MLGPGLRKGYQSCRKAKTVFPPNIKSGSILGIGAVESQRWNRIDTANPAAAGTPRRFAPLVAPTSVY